MIEIILFVVNVVRVADNTELFCMVSPLFICLLGCLKAKCYKNF